MADSGFAADRLGKLMAEANELVAIITAARKTTQKGG
jgi:hypothetical protein